MRIIVNLDLAAGAAEIAGKRYTRCESCGGWQEEEFMDLPNCRCNHCTAKAAFHCTDGLPAVHLTISDAFAARLAEVKAQRDDLDTWSKGFNAHD